ncbi:MAG: nitrous oxide-stimulated promoter family protein [Bacteroidales bacterium]
MNRRIRREQRTVEVMIGMFCRDRHKQENGLCASCSALVIYSRQRTEKCQFGDGKPVCVHCPVHCYKPDMREKIREVMRFAGPRMMVEHPYLGIMHLIDKKIYKKYKKV